jgi:hypothetical protein
MEIDTDKTLADELLRMAATDQAMRMQATQDKRAWNASVDEVNSVRLQEIVSAHGWPTASRVGVAASHAAWLLVQHAPSLLFMKRCLMLMKALPAHEVNPADSAYLEDRILMREGKPQIYGTQFQGRGKSLCVYLITDPEHVDERRRSVCLDSLAENEACMRKMYE